MRYKIRELGAPGPIGSMPALEAAKCAQAQGEEQAERFHQLVMSAYFEEGLDISDPKVLAALAKKAGLDMRRFRRELKSAAHKEVVLRERVEGETLGINGIPTVVFADRAGFLKVVGEVPIATYRRVLDYLGAS